MAGGYDILEYKGSSAYLLEIADNTRYFYNDRQKILRVRYGRKLFDFPCQPGLENPDPARHAAMCFVSDKVLEDSDGIVNERLDLPPGWVDNEGTLATIDKAFCFLVNKAQYITTTNPQNASAGFSISKTNMFDKDKVVYSLTPPLEDRDYTTKEPQSDLNSENVGVFINKDGTILVKSRGGSLTLGDEGVHVGGRFLTESSATDTGPLSDNTISDLIPSTIPTAGAAYPKLPNIGLIANVANAGMKFMSIADKVQTGFDTVKRIASI